MIKLNMLTVGYKCGDILRDISVDFNKGELHSIIGINGSGKSTLLKSIVGIISHKGEISVNSDEISALNEKARAKRIAYLPQSRRVPDMSVFSLVLHGRFSHAGYPAIYSDTDREIADAALAEMELDGYKEKPISQLSGGERQRAYIAMTLAQGSEHILLDEPTTYLDPSAKLSLMRKLRSLAGAGKCIVTVLHDLTLALSFSDRISIISEGKILLTDTPERVLKSGLIPKIFGVEVGFFDGEYFVKTASR